MTGSRGQAVAQSWPSAGVGLYVSLTDVVHPASESSAGEAEPSGRQPHHGPTPQGLSIVLEDKNYTVSGEEDPHVHFRVKASSLNLMLDVTISSKYNLTLIWNKHMTVFIKIARASQVPAPPLPYRSPGSRGSACPPHLTPAPTGRSLRLVWQLQREHEGRL